MEKQERELSLGQIFWRILFSWRFVIVCAVVFAVIVGGVFYAKDLKAYKAASAPQETEETVFTAEEQEQIDQAVSVSRLLDENRQYMTSSVLMNLDPYQENVLILQYYVNANYTFNYTQENKNDYTNAVVIAYCNNLLSGDVLQQLSEVLDCEQNYVAELISTGTNNAATGIFTVQVVYSDSSAFEQVAEIITAGITDQTELISQDIGSHTVELLSKNTEVTVDRTLADTQKAVQDKINNYSTTLESLKEDLSDEQLAALETEKTEEETTEIEEVAAPEISVKYVGLGVIIGIILAAVWIVVKMLLTGELQDTNEITELFHLQLMGTLRFERRKRNLFLDKLLLKIRYRNSERLSAEKSLDIVEANIELACKTENVNRLYITSSLQEAMQEDVWQALQEKLKTPGIEAIYGGRVCYEPQFLREMADVGNVIVVEQLEKSVYSEIEREITLMNDRGIRILGGIAIEAV